jgi:hypothetical protein
MWSMMPAESPCMPRLGATESSSSKNTAQRCAVRAHWNTHRMFASDSPMYMFSSSGPFIEKKFSEHNVATALTRSILPVPGRPYSRIPVEQRCGGCWSSSQWWHTIHFLDMVTTLPFPVQTLPVHSPKVTHTCFLLILFPVSYHFFWHPITLLSLITTRVLYSATSVISVI